MAIVTNKHGAPASLVEFANAPHYDSEGSDFTVTQLMDSPRIRILRAEHAEQVEDDVYENIFRLVGTAIHSIAERHTGGYSVEQRVHLDLNGIDVSGAMDVTYQNEDGTFTIGDYKFTSVYALSHSPESSWSQQLNLYAHLFEKTDPDHAIVGRLEVYAILRDWSWRSAQRDRSYPKTPGITVEIAMWSPELRKAFFEERLNLHMDADLMLEFTDEIPPCTAEEMWEKPATFAVKRPDASRALRVLASEEEATEWIEERKMSKAMIERREGERTRCENFCEVARFCDQNKEYLNGK